MKRNFGLNQVKNTCSMRELTSMNPVILDDDKYTEKDFMDEVNAYKKKYRFDPFKTIIYNTTFSAGQRRELVKKFSFKEISSYVGNHHSTVYIMQKNV